MKKRMHPASAGIFRRQLKRLPEQPKSRRESAMNSSFEAAVVLRKRELPVLRLRTAAVRRQIEKARENLKSLLLTGDSVNAAPENTQGQRRIMKSRVENSRMPSIQDQ